jgi:hypothetical protein
MDDGDLRPLLELEPITDDDPLPSRIAITEAEWADLPRCIAAIPPLSERQEAERNTLDVIAGEWCIDPDVLLRAAVGDTNPD